MKTFIQIVFTLNMFYSFFVKCFQLLPFFRMRICWCMHVFSPSLSLSDRIDNTFFSVFRQSFISARYITDAIFSWQNSSAGLIFNHIPSWTINYTIYPWLCTENFAMKFLYLTPEFFNFDIAFTFAAFNWNARIKSADTFW